MTCTRTYCAVGYLSNCTGSCTPVRTYTDDPASYTDVREMVEARAYFRHAANAQSEKGLCQDDAEYYARVEDAFNRAIEEADMEQEAAAEAYHEAQCDATLYGTPVYVGLINRGYPPR